MIIRKKKEYVFLLLYMNGERKGSDTYNFFHASIDPINRLTVNQRSNMCRWEANI